MFSWATKQFEQITNTLAPPPDDAVGRFVYCCQRDDEDGALACVPELPGAGVIVNAAKGQVPLHVACQSSMLRLVRELMSQPGASADLRDGAGNTCLHAACASQKPTALDLVKVLVAEYRANVCDKNSQGETPYDVSQLNSIRQYLLPIQLQKETQEALDNGGVGLPPGIDLGGLRITNSTLAPPPMGGALPPPPISGGLGAALPPPPMGGAPPMMMASAPAPQFASAPPSTTSPPGVAIPAYASPTPPAQPMMMASTPPHIGMSQGDRSMSAPVSASSAAAIDGPGQGVTVPPAPVSGGRHEYALTGHSSAAIYNPQGRRVIRPDGFHSSSSDKRLQQKYGHEHAGLHVPKAVPPPPSSGNSAPRSGGYAGLSQSASSPAMGWSTPSGPGGAYANPYAGGSRHLSSSRRYVAVDPATGQALASSTATPPTSGSLYGSMTPTPPQSASANFTVFMPGSASSSSAAASPAPAATVSPTALSPPPPSLSSSIPPTRPGNQFGSASSASPSAPPPLQQQQPSMYQPPVGSYSPQTQQTSSPDRASSTFSQAPGSATPPGGQLFGGSLRGTSTGSAEQLFATNPSATMERAPDVLVAPPAAATVFAAVPAAPVAPPVAPPVSTGTFPSPPVLSTSKFPLPPHMQRALQQSQPAIAPAPLSSGGTSALSAVDVFASAADAAPIASSAAPSDAVDASPVASEGPADAMASTEGPAAGESAPPASIGPPSNTEEGAPGPFTLKLEKEEDPDNDADDGMLDDIPLSPEAGNKSTMKTTRGDVPPPPSTS